MPEYRMYRILDVSERAKMIQDALHQLETTRYEAELNAVMSDEGDRVLVAQGETAADRIARIDRQLDRLFAVLEELEA